ncbi:MAG: Htur_1727 family rSAM-partnered candidate RiPP [Halorhabdus sp.]
MTTDADARREPVDQPRGRHSIEWEVFVRDAVEEPLRHVGSVTAADQSAAREQADALFEDVAALWFCPAEAVLRDTVTTLTPGEPA